MVNDCLLAWLIFGVFFTNAAKLDIKKFLNFNDPNVQEFSKLVDKFKFDIKNVKEMNQRLANFQKSKEDVIRYNKEYKGATFETNEFSLMSKEEIKNVGKFLLQLI